MPRIRIDGDEFVAPAGLTVLQAAKLRGVEIPHLCFAEGCTAETSCLVCLVRIDGTRRLVPSCATVVAEGMVIHSNTPEVREARKTALELILAEHNGDCFAPCSNVCPAHLDIPGMVRAFRGGDLREAAGLARDALVLPATLGAVCQSLCERGCRRVDTGGAVAIHALHRHIAELDLAARDPWLPALTPARGQRVAVVGAGAAGLAAAYELRKLGHPVDVFHRGKSPGGLLRKAAEEAGLPLATLDAEVALLQRIGVAMHYCVTVGVDIALARLQEDFAAVLLTPGALTKEKVAALGLPAGQADRLVNRVTYRLPQSNLYMAGAAQARFEHAISAVAAGRAAARAIHASLAGHLVPPRNRFAVRMGKLSPEEMSSLLASASLQARMVEDGRSVTPLDALCEAGRCANCGCDAASWCRLRQYAIDYDCDANRYRDQRRPFRRVVGDSLVVFEPGKCIACGLCVQVTARHKEELGLTFVGRGFDISIGVPFDEPLQNALKKCADAACAICPTGALTRPAGLPGGA